MRTLPNLIGDHTVKNNHWNDKETEMSRYRHRIIYKVPKPMPVILSINHHSWDPRVEYEEVKHANGKPVRVNNLNWKHYSAGACLVNLKIQKNDSNFLISCDDITFDCIPQDANKPTENKIHKCLERMRKGKCPHHKLARALYTNLEK